MTEHRFFSIINIKEPMGSVGIELDASECHSPGVIVIFFAGTPFRYTFDFCLA